MRVLAGGCRVYSAEDGQISTLGNWTARIVICQTSGARRITQTVSEYASGSSGSSPAVVNPGSEEVLYAASGQGKCRIREFEYTLHSGIAVFVPPGAVYHIENTGREIVHIISSCCPEDPERRIVNSALDGTIDRACRDDPRLLVDEELRADIRAGQDRRFRYLVDAELGSKQITQFVGWIPPSKAPVHYHVYEEAIFILQGHGVVHTEGASCEFTAGSSIYFPVGVRHCVENPGNSTIKLLGTFYPSGSPNEAYEPGD